MPSVLCVHLKPTRCRHPRLFGEAQLRQRSLRRSVGGPEQRHGNRRRPPDGRLDKKGAGGGRVRGSRPLCKKAFFLPCMFRFCFRFHFRVTLGTLRHAVVASMYSRNKLKLRKNKIRNDFPGKVNLTRKAHV